MNAHWVYKVLGYSCNTPNGSTTFSPATGIGTTSTATDIAFPPTSGAGASVYRGHCLIAWQQITGISTVEFLIKNSTNASAEYVTTNSSPGAYLAPFVSGNITGTAPTAITTTMAPAAFGVNYTTEIDVLASSTAQDTVSIYALSGSNTDTISIQPGSYCSWLP